MFKPTKAEEGLGGGDPEMEAAAKTAGNPTSQEEEEDEDELDPEVAKKKAKQLARKGITFQAKEDPKVMPRTLGLVTLSRARCLKSLKRMSIPYRIR